MKYYLCFLIGLLMGQLLNSHIGESYGIMAGRYLREKLIKHNMLPDAWKKPEQQND